MGQISRVQLDSGPNTLTGLPCISSGMRSIVAFLYDGLVPCFFFFSSLFPYVPIILDKLWGSDRGGLMNVCIYSDGCIESRYMVTTGQDGTGFE